MKNFHEGPKKNGQPLTGNLEFTISGKTEFDGTQVDAWWCPGVSEVKFENSQSCLNGGDSSSTNSDSNTNSDDQFEGHHSYDKLRRRSAGEVHFWNFLIKNVIFYKYVVANLTLATFKYDLKVSR